MGEGILELEKLETFVSMETAFSIHEKRTINLGSMLVSFLLTFMTNAAGTKGNILFHCISYY